ncbi:MAG TPA: phosphatidylserine/phosphatidylglycerophosphate/cardiolipin synthase family protein [Candidatus Ozemobacteraceae bacterium]|nr:phosphatidylserine/phosphatidylglycerophosphate/cardiolipin synthase family protein [Candidatus Ozemobacteraceae bacterium]
MATFRTTHGAPEHRSTLAGAVLCIAVALLFCITALPATSEAFTRLPLNTELQSVFTSFPAADANILARTRLLTGNEESWYARWHMLESARESIVSTYFIVDNDIFGWSFLGLLQKKAREGVKVKLMIDARFLRGARKIGDFDELEELARMPGVEVRLYNPVGRSLLHVFQDLRQVLLSNHDKIIIIDGKLAMTGGRNIGADYFAQMGEHDNVFRDMDLVLEGPNVVKQLQRAFDEEWIMLRTVPVKPDLVNLRDQTAKLDLAYRVMSRYMQGRGLYAGEPELDGGLKKQLTTYAREIVKYKRLSGYASFELFRGERLKPVKILDKHSMLGTREDIGPNLIRLIDACKHQILIQNAYVVLSPDAEKALVRAAARGVKIVLNTNSGESTNHGSTVAFFMNDWKRLLATMPGARILVFPAGSPCLHTKAFVFDRQVTVVGTYNLDPLSDVVNSEVVAVIQDFPFSEMTAQRMERQFGECLEYKIDLRPDGSIRTVFGPESHTSAEMMKKLNRLRKFQWIRPLI